jgi:hypothetical protein
MEKGIYYRIIQLQWQYQWQWQIKKNLRSKI